MPMRNEADYEPIILGVNLPIVSVVKVTASLGSNESCSCFVAVDQSGTNRVMRSYV